MNDLRAGRVRRRIRAVMRRTSVVTLLSAVSLVAAGPALAQSRTTAPTPTVAIRVSISDGRVVLIPSDSVERGTSVIFVIVNHSRYISRFSIAGVTTKPLVPRARVLLKVRFISRGTFPFSAREDGTSDRPRGTLIVF